MASSAMEDGVVAAAATGPVIGDPSPGGDTVDGDEGAKTDTVVGETAKKDGGEGDKTDTVVDAAKEDGKTDTEIAKKDDGDGDSKKDGEPKDEAPPVIDTTTDLSDKASNLSPDAVETVKAPGIVERAAEEVEAITEALQEKLNLKSDKEDEMVAPKKKESGSLLQRLIKMFRDRGTK